MDNVARVMGGSMQDMGDAARPTKELFRQTYDTAYWSWKDLYSDSIKASPLPPSYLSILDLFPHHPHLPPSLRLRKAEPNQIDEPERIFATGKSAWGSSLCHDDQNFSPFQRNLELEVAASSPVTLSIDESATRGPGLTSWFWQSGTNYIPVLMMAWAYVLSARWAALLPGPCSMTCTESQAEYEICHADQTVNAVDIGRATPPEARWWAAVLASGQGWRATTVDGTNVSPWSIKMQGRAFSLRLSESTAWSASPEQNQAAAASFSTAVQFFGRFCRRHGIIDQSHAALAAVILLPTFGRRPQSIQLRQPVLDRGVQLSDMECDQKDLSSPFHGLRLDWLYGTQHIDRLLALSCNIRGIRCSLLSVFFDSTVPCNLVTPWLQGTFAAIESLVTDDDSHILGRMLMDRAPPIAFLWVGATILQAQSGLLQEARRGQIQVDLYTAVWSGATQSFLQQPVSNPLVEEGCVSRADECRLLFLSQSGQHARTPVCQWKPFGATPLRDVDLEVRVHEFCGSHWLQYQGFFWDCDEGTNSDQPSFSVMPQPHHAPTVSSNVRNDDDISHQNLDCEKEVVSENATRSIFGWLRYDGWVPHEQDIRTHEWFEVYDSDEEDDKFQDDESAPERRKDESSITAWLSAVDDSEPCFRSTTTRMNLD